MITLFPTTTIIPFGGIISTFLRRQLDFHNARINNYNFPSVNGLDNPDTAFEVCVANSEGVCSMDVFRRELKKLNFGLATLRMGLGKSIGTQKHLVHTPDEFRIASMVWEVRRTGDAFFPIKFVDGNTRAVGLERWTGFVEPNKPYLVYKLK